MMSEQLGFISIMLSSLQATGSPTYDYITFRYTQRYIACLVNVINFIKNRLWQKNGIRYDYTISYSGAGDHFQVW
jgi:hypothetical protein